VERDRRALQGIQRTLATGISDKERDNLVAMQQKAQRELKRYEDASSISTTVLGERRQ
jgi:hypothetical protein